MKYKKKLESYINKTNSNKKIKGGTLDDTLAMYYGFYIIAIIYNNYCIGLRLWCNNYLSITNTDIKTDKSISEFIYKYYISFTDTYLDTITSLELIEFVQYSHYPYKNQFIDTIIYTFEQLFEKYSHSLTDGKFKLFKPDIKKIIEKLTIDIIVDFDDDDEEDKKKKLKILYELYALYLMALINYKLHQEISLLNKDIGYFYYNIPEVSDENIRDCVDFYNKRLYDLLIKCDINEQQSLFTTLGDNDNLENYKKKIKTTTNTYVESFIDNLKKKDPSEIRMLSIFLREYDSDIDNELIFFMNKGIEGIILKFRESELIIDENYGVFTKLKKYILYFKQYLAMDRAIKSKNILQQFAPP